MHFGLPPTPAHFVARVQATGAHRYGPIGYVIARDDTGARNEQIAEHLRNYGAPCMALFCIDRELAASDVASVGIHLQSVILLLWKSGWDAIPQASMGAYMQVWKELLDFPDELQIVCGLAIGYPDEGAKVVRMRMPKDD